MKKQSTATNSTPQNTSHNGETMVYKTFQEFWPKYVHEHRNVINQRMHFIGTNIAVMLILSAILLKNPMFLLFAAVSGYSFAWIGHFFFEKNTPLTFTYPWMSFRADFKAFGITWKKILTRH